MKNLTRLGTSTYHPTIDSGELNLCFNQSNSCHIPSINVGSQDANNQGSSEIKPPPPLGYDDLTKTIQEITKPKTSFNFSKFLHHYLEVFSYLHPPIKGFLEIKTPPPPTLGNCLETPSLGSKSFQQSKGQPEKNPITLIQEIERQCGNLFQMRRNPCQ